MGERLVLAARGRGAPRPGLARRCAVDARDVFRTDDRHRRRHASISAPAARPVLRATCATGSGAVPVVTGFIGRARDGATTTLGRNGSDYTAATLAALLGAAEVTIWTDVAG